jgi:hypothetical protein
VIIEVWIHQKLLLQQRNVWLIASTIQRPTGAADKSHGSQSSAVSAERFSV